MRIAVHPRFEGELEALANRGFAYERAIGPIFGLIDEHWVEANTIEDALRYFDSLPFADGHLGRAEGLRALDAPEGLVGTIVAVRDDVLLLLAANSGLAVERLAAVHAALARIEDLSWVVPEEE